MHNCHLHLHNLSDHVARIHKEHTGSSLKCPSCNEVVLPSDLFDHMHFSCVARILPLSPSKISDQPKLTSDPKEATKPPPSSVELKLPPKVSQEESHSQTSPDQQKSILIPSQEVTKPPVSSDRSESTQNSSP